MVDGTSRFDPDASSAGGGSVGVGEPPCAPLVALLYQLAELIRSLSDEQYARQPVGPFDSSIGGHVRHCLDHVATLLTMTEQSALNYDNRRRGTPVESSRRAALDEIEALAGCVDQLRQEHLDRPIEVSGMLSADGPTRAMRSTVARELLFVVSHTVHHNAIIGAIAALLGVRTPERFGYAPSTIAYLRRGACAPSPSQR